jgi:hypothetical protein
LFLYFCCNPSSEKFSFQEGSNNVSLREENAC